MSQLLSLQFEFTRKLTFLINFLHSEGYECTVGDAYRSSKCNYGHPNSLHKKRLAIDLNLFKDGIYLRDTSDYKEVGEYWESLGGSWGGRFEDGNHFSLPYLGMR